MPQPRQDGKAVLQAAPAWLARAEHVFSAAGNMHGDLRKKTKAGKPSRPLSSPPSILTGAPLIEPLTHPVPCYPCQSDACSPDEA